MKIPSHTRRNCWVKKVDNTLAKKKFHQDEYRIKGVERSNPEDTIRIKYGTHFIYKHEVKLIAKLREYPTTV